MANILILSGQGLGRALRQPQLPQKWVVTVSHSSSFCANLLIDILDKVFTTPTTDSVSIYLCLHAQVMAVAVVESLTKDMAETLADKANKMASSEQDGCPCKSSLLFEAQPETKDGQYGPAK